MKPRITLHHDGYLAIATDDRSEQVPSVKKFVGLVASLNNVFLNPFSSYKYLELPGIGDQ